MPPQKTQISCPRCRKPIAAVIEQLFDVTSDPAAKQRLLGGVSNMAVCSSCGFSGPLSMPIIYHDADKELLLTFFPPELSLPVNEQEKLAGPMITQVTNKLPLEKRKAYLLRPQSFFTYQSLIERILGADGVTPEMIQAQQKRVSLVDRLLNAATQDARSKIILEDATTFDAEFFLLFGRLLESALSSGQEPLIKEMENLQKILLEETEYGRKIACQYAETQEAIRTLEAAGKSLDRDKLLEIMIDAPNDVRLIALVNMTRPGLDYQFFQALSERIDKSLGELKLHLEGLRTKLLDMARNYDARMEEEVRKASELLEKLLNSNDIQKSTIEHIPEFNEIFVQVLNRALQEANKKNDTLRMPKLQEIVGILQMASAPSTDVEVLEKLLLGADDDSIIQIIEENSEKITPNLIDAISNIISQSEKDGGEKELPEEKKLLDKLRQVYRLVLRYSMKKNM